MRQILALMPPPRPMLAYQTPEMPNLPVDGYRSDLCYGVNYGEVCHPEPRPQYSTTNGRDAQEIALSALVLSSVTHGWDGCVGDRVPTLGTALHCRRRNDFGWAGWSPLPQTGKNGKRRSG